MKSKIREKIKESIKNIGNERIEILLNLAREYSLKNSNSELSRRYVHLAREIAKFCNIRLGKRKKEFCKYCDTYFNSKNCRIRINSKKRRVEILCLNCGKKRFYGY